MRYKSIYLVNYIGIYNGMKIDKIFIDFDKCKHNMLVIKGDNGSGKSTLFKAISILQDDSTMFIPRRSAKKVVEVSNGEFDYRIEYIHEFKNGGYATKGFFYKGINGEYELCNSNGNVTACKELIFSEFNLDSNFASLAELSSNDRGLVSKIPSARKQNFNNIISGIEVYNQIYKTLSKRSSVFKSMINSITSKIRTIGDEQLLTTSATSIEQRILGLEASKEELIASIAKDQNLVGLLDPTGQIQVLYDELSDKRTELMSTKQSLTRVMNTLINKAADITPDVKLLASLEASIERAASDKIDKQTTINRLLKQNEDDAAKLNEKRAKLESLTNSTNYNSLKAMKVSLEKEISEAEAFFIEAGIENRNMTSDEYVVGLNTLLDIKVIIDTMRDRIPQHIIQESISNIHSIDGILSYEYPDIDTIVDQIAGLQNINKDLSIEMAEYRILANTASKLQFKPEECNFNTCYFIKDAVEADTKNPLGNIDRISKEISDNELLISDLEKRVEHDSMVIEAMHSLHQICRFIGSRNSILSKLPNGYIFSNVNELFIRLNNGSNFNEIADIYKYISQASMFEQYHTAVNKLANVNNELKIYEAKNELIEEIISDINKLESEVTETLRQVEICNTDIRSIDMSVLQYQTKVDKVRSLIEVDTNLRSVDAELISINEQLMSIRESMIQIQTALNNKTANTDKLNNIRTQIRNLERERNSIDYAIKQLAEYKEELAEFNAKYEKIEFIKKCASPTKGIQLIFIELYLRDIIRTANELLSMVMGGEFRLLKPIIDDRSFNFPCIGDGLPHDDISSLSSGQASIMSVVLSASIMFHSSTKFNVLKFDEVDGQLDTMNRTTFLYMVDQVRHILQCEQCIIITHNNELDLRNADLIILKNSDDDLYNCGANIIYQYQ